MSASLPPAPGPAARRPGRMRGPLGLALGIVAALVLSSIIAVGIATWSGAEAHPGGGGTGPPAGEAEVLPPDGRADPELPSRATVLVPPDGALPPAEECVDRVSRDPWEPRPANGPANNRTPAGPPPYGMTTWYSDEASGPRYRGRVDGAFTGTTDEILQWAACKWGFPADLVRAQAAVETEWRQSFVGDGGESFGLFQMRDTYWGGHPNSARATAFNADWALGLLRACYDGAMWYPQLRGDLDACIGVHFSGDPDPATWREYTAEVRQAEAERPWLSWPSDEGIPPP